ncbi:hypothetical protein QBC32DRAFT_329111 [Pseudoneurospora amorphoporcata]|uniref:Heterokaryon incompatibility domain-containing protein n=1 Tax=Pseudoneurospora amorphoporcata TaxID=241081 RepID=A0AAN6NKB5_9PEZI|nr:hypothetical protein QBC32DRAFT_329111 [Pseudoneurospora amorphoporcata]
MGNGSPRQSKLTPESRDMEPNRLCARCSRALTTSKKLWQPRPPGDPLWVGEKFFYSKNTKQMLADSVIAAGCHLCTQVSLDANFSHAEDDQRVMVEYEEPQGDSTTILLATFKLERTDSSGRPKSLLPQKLPDGSMFVLPSSTDSPEGFGLVRHWLDNCLKNHPGCKGSNFQRLPTKLVEIDSLCIMQDSPEDWNREAQTIAAVYGNSLLTIFTSGMGMEGGQGANADTCFLIRNPLELYASIVTSPLSDGGASYYAIRNKYEPNVDEMLWGA